MKSSTTWLSSPIRSYSLPFLWFSRNHVYCMPCGQAICFPGCQGGPFVLEQTTLSQWNALTPLLWYGASADPSRSGSKVTLPMKPLLIPQEITLWKKKYYDVQHSVESLSVYTPFLPTRLVLGGEGLCFIFTDTFLFYLQVLAQSQQVVYSYERY